MKEKEDFWIEIRNWEKFQHYKKETRPAWLKLYVQLDTDENWIQLSSSARGILIELWLAAARSANKLCAPIKILEKIAHCRIPFKTLKTLEKHGFIFLHSRVTLDSVYNDSRETLPREDKRREDKRDSIEPSAQIPSIKEIWNSNRGHLPEVLEISAKRQKTWSSRWKEKPEETYWARAVQRLANSAFCCGENDRKWKARLEYLLRPDMHLEIMEGKHDDSNPQLNLIKPEIIRSTRESLSN